MFRISLRELFLLTTCVALGTGWWLDHRLKVEAAEDARMLAHYSVTGGVGCGLEAGGFVGLQKKYGAKPFRIILSGDEEKLGIDFEDP